ncbi:MAG: protein translocase subunit SecF [Chloroflexales bacterium]|nr:protein translocase subunit SecF [Chloroflexales bacterium]
MEKIVQRRYWWFLLSALIIVPGLYFLLLHPLFTTGRFELGLRPSIDFSGGALWELQVRQPTKPLNTDEIAAVFRANGFAQAQAQISTTEVDNVAVPTMLVRTESLSATDPNTQQNNVLTALRAQYGEVTRERLESVGATLSQESTRSAIIAVIGASLAIMLYMVWAFRHAPNPFRYGACSIVSMFHDIVLMLGVASILGYFFQIEVDVLFVTALLTILAFSIHDKIVVFDRIRENLIARRSGEVFDEIVNRSIVQTLPRSINTQLTPLFTLTVLLLFGGASLRNFVVVLLIGLVSGTYSSIFTAAQLLVVWEHREWRNWFGRGRVAEATA